MPWNPGGAAKHKKNLSSKQKRQWAHVANSMLERTGDEGKAVRAANAVSGRRGAIQRRLKNGRSAKR